MSPLEKRLQEQKQLINKGYSTEEIHCAATMQIADRLEERLGNIDANLECIMDDLGPLLKPQIVMKEVHSADD